MNKNKKGETENKVKIDVAVNSFGGVENPPDLIDRSPGARAAQPCGVRRWFMALRCDSLGERRDGEMTGDLSWW